MENTRPVIEKTYDIVVIGGGVAGTCAAIAAARLGSKVALIQDRPVLGGNSSSEVRVWAIGASTQGYFRNARETGIIEEWTLEAAFRSPGLPPIYAEPYPMWDMVLKEWCDREPGLDLYLNSRAYQVQVEDARILSVTVLQTSTEKTFRLKAKYFIESSGDGEIGHLAGAIWRLGQESRSEFGESLAPVEANRKVLPSTLLFSTQDVGYPVSFVPPDWAYDFPTEEDLPFRNHKYIKSGYWWISTGGDKDTINDNEEIRDELHKILFGVWDHIKNHGDHGADHLVLNWIGQVVGKRESRRFEGDLIILQDDMLNGRVFPDGVAYGGWPLDLHPSEGFFDRDVPTDQIEVAKPYSIPFRSLYSRNIENLFLNGRLISASHVAMGTIRVQKTLGLVGQAVGTAAYLCLQKNITPRQLGQHHIQELQQALLKQDCYIPHVCNQDPHDLALTARVTASSTAPLPPVTPKDRHPLDTSRAQKFVTSEPRVERVRAYFVSELDQEILLTGRLHSSPELWDFLGGEILATATVRLSPRFEGWVSFEFGQPINPACPYWLEVEPAPGVFWVHSLDEPVGCLSACWSDKKIVRLGLDGPAPKNALQGEGEGTWRHLRGTYLFQVEPQPYPYGPQNVVNGVTRPEKGANLWISNPQAQGPHWIELEFPEPVTFDTLQLTFDSNLDRAMDEGGQVLTGPVPEIMAHYIVTTWQMDSWQPLFEETSNHQRARRYSFPAVRSQRLRIEFFLAAIAKEPETPADVELNRPALFPRVRSGPPAARLFEVRLYHNQQGSNGTGD